LCCGLNPKSNRTRIETRRFQIVPGDFHLV